MVDHIIETGETWTDPDFRPDESSFFCADETEAKKEKFGKFSWKRASEIYKNPKIFAGII